MKRLALVASFCGITITQMMAQNINGEQISDTTLFDKFSKELGEVVVKAHLPQYKKTHEGLLTNVAGTVLSKMGTADDVLKHVPSIVKKKDGYEVVGKGTPIIYINGRKMQDISELDNIKSSDIKSVEVIQNPGAAYDASVNAVIKIKTIKKKGEGFGFDTRSVYWYNKHDNTIQQINMNYRHNGLNLFATYKFSDATWMQKATYEQTVHVDTLWQQHNNNEVTGRIESHRLISGFSYDFNANHSIGARYTLTSPGYSRSKDFFDSQVTADGKFYDYIKTDGLTVNKDSPSHQLNAYYNGIWGKTTIDLNTDLYFSTNRAYAYSDEQSQEHDSRNINSKNRVSNKMVATKLVITSLLLGGNLSYGAEYINTHRNDDYEVNRTDLLANSYSKLEEQTASPFIQYARLTRQERIFRFPHRQTGAVQYFSVPHPSNVPHSAWLWQSALAFFRYRWQTCNRRGGDPVTHVLFDAECVPDAPVFLLPLCAVFPQHSGRGTGSVVGENLFRREQE